MNKAVFFDRDGTLNEEVHYLHKIEDFKWIEGAIDAIKYCNDNGYLAIVITNQSGVARGDYPESEKLAGECLALPVFPGLTMEEQVWVAETMAKFYKK